MRTTRRSVWRNVVTVIALAVIGFPLWIGILLALWAVLRAAGAANALVSGAIVGAITGAALLRLLRENRQVLAGLREEAEQAKQ